MPNLKEFLDTIPKQDLSFAEIDITEENKNDRGYPYILQSSAKISCMILEKYHNWLLENYNIIPKN